MLWRVWSALGETGFLAGNTNLGAQQKPRAVVVYLKPAAFHPERPARAEMLDFG
jgi:hypothetical protein